jgi:hypothetical protein
LDQHVIGGRLHELAIRPLPPQSGRVTLSPCTPDEALPALDEGYDTLGAEMLDLVSRATRSQLEACVEKGRLCLIMVDEITAGLIGVERHAEFGLEGYVVIEEIITAPFRGQGLAKAAQRAMIDRLAADAPQAAFFGTIAGENTPSLRTALGVGRHKVGAYWWLFPEGRSPDGFGRVPEVPRA